MLRKHQREGGWRPLAGLALAVAMACLGARPVGCLWLGAASPTPCSSTGAAEERPGRGSPLLAPPLSAWPPRRSSSFTLELARSNYRLLAGNTTRAGGRPAQLIAPQAHGHINLAQRVWRHFGFHNCIGDLRLRRLVSSGWRSGAAGGEGPLVPRGTGGGRRGPRIEGPHQSALRRAAPAPADVERGQSRMPLRAGDAAARRPPATTLRRMDWATRSAGRASPPAA